MEQFESATWGGLEAYEANVCEFAELAGSWDVGAVLYFWLTDTPQSVIPEVQHVLTP